MDVVSACVCVCVCVCVWSAAAVLDGLALDTANSKIYYADAGTPGKIGEVTYDGTRHRVLVTEWHSKPRSIVLDASSRCA